MAVIDELLVGLGFDYDPDDLDKFKSDLNTTTSAIKNLAAVAVAGAVAITGIAIASTAASDEQGKMADEIGDSVENLNALQFALTRSGGTAEGMSQSLRKLAIRAGETARGMGEGVEVFKALGISVKDSNGDVKKSSDLILEVAGAMEGLSKTEQIEFANKLGLRSSIRLLQQGESGIAELVKKAKSLGVTTDEDARLAADFQDSLTDIAKITKQLARLFSRIFVPILESIINVFTEWWEANREIIEQNLPIWVERLSAIFKVLVVITAAWLALRLANHLFQLVGIMRAMGAAAIFTNAALFLLPAIILGAITAIGLLAQDAKVFFEGGQSFIGDMIKKYPEWAEEITAVAAAFAVFAELISMAWEGLKGIANILSNLSVQGIKDVVSNIPGFLGDVTGASSVASNIPGFLGDVTGASSVASNIPGFLGDVTGASSLGQSIADSDIGKSISNTASTTVDKIEILIQGGADTAENIANEVLSVFQQTSQDLNSAVDQ